MCVRAVRQSSREARTLDSDTCLGELNLQLSFELVYADGILGDSLVARSVSTSPTTLQNLYLCPAKSAATATCGYSGWVSR